jgi:CheY-like chemotaxis protein
MVSPGEEALEKTEESRSKVVLTDIFPDSDMNGIEAAEQMHTRLDIPAAYLGTFSDPGLQVTRPGLSSSPRAGDFRHDCPGNAFRSSGFSVSASLRTVPREQ